MCRMLERLLVAALGGLMMAATPWLDRWTFSEVSQRFGDGQLTVGFVVSGDGPRLPIACLRLVDDGGTVLYRGLLARLTPADPGRPAVRAVPVDATVWSRAASMVLSLTFANCDDDPSADLAVAIYPTSHAKR